ncbi:restriction endonuclease subunit S [[Ruminococcus] lactaris]|nr:restriction endonuclease subunit S [[Ruminococcus] lactaris]
METRNSKTEIPLFKVKDEKFIFAVQMKLQGKCRVVGENRMEKIKLTDICNPKQWKTIPTSELLEDGYPVYGANGIIGYYSEFNHKNPVITVTCRGATCGTINITVPKSYVTGNAMCLDDVRSDIYMEYLYYCLKHYNFNNVISGSAQPQITRQGMEKIYVTIGSHNEQMDIVDKLKKVENVIGLKKQELKQLDTFVKSRFVEMFGDPVANDKEWTTLPLEEACKTIVDCPHSTPSYTTENTGFMCIRTSIVKKNKILWDDIEYIPEDEFIKRIQRKKPEIGDVVYTREGAILGIAAIIDRECNVALGQRSMLLSPDANKCLSEFLCVAMNCDSFLDNALKGIAGSASPHINVGDIKSFKMIMPPIELQNQFADFVQQVDKSKSKIQKSLEETQLLFDSLMQKYFG